MSIRGLSHSKDWTAPQRRMMRQAGRVHGLRALGAVALIALLGWAGHRRLLGTRNRFSTRLTV